MWTLIKARHEGAEAYWNYGFQHDCPYDDGQDESLEWIEGFIEARAIDNGDA